MGYTERKRKERPSAVSGGSTPLTILENQCTRMDQPGLKVETRPAALHSSHIRSPISGRPI